MISYHLILETTNLLFPVAVHCLRQKIPEISYNIKNDVLLKSFPDHSPWLQYLLIE